MESDCLEAVLDIKNEILHTLKAGLIYKLYNTREIIASLKNVSIMHASRSCNRVAHRLAVIAYEADHDDVWHDQAPNCIQDFLLLECNQP